jgi:hypothetical protein
MGSIQVREELQKFFNQADERFLKVVHAMMKEYVRDLKVVGYNPDGVPLSKEELIIRARLSNQAIQKRKIKSVKQIRKDSKSW